MALNKEKKEEEGEERKREEKRRREEEEEGGGGKTTNGQFRDIKTGYVITLESSKKWDEKDLRPIRNNKALRDSGREDNSK